MKWCIKVLTSKKRQFRLTGLWTRLRTSPTRGCSIRVWGQIPLCYRQAGHRGGHIPLSQRLPRRAVHRCRHHRRACQLALIIHRKRGSESGDLSVSAHTRGLLHGVTLLFGRQADVSSTGATETEGAVARIRGVQLRGKSTDGVLLIEGCWGLLLLLMGVGKT